jgi:ABC-2 type transport system ATP-binding protein
MQELLTSKIMNALVQADKLHRYYGERCAVREIGFTLDAGEVVGFLGPNGAGKSTTLKLLSGNLAPSSGRVLINGIDIHAKPREAKYFLGYLPENPPLHRESTVDEYLRFCATIHRVPFRSRTQCLATAKRRCGLSEVGERLIANLSQGFRQRLAIAQAIVHSPPVIILDEPTVGLDPIQIREIRELIRELGKDHGVIFSSHILSEVQWTCTRALIIHQGRLILDTDMEGLQQNLGNSSLVVETRRPLDLMILQGVAGVDSVEVMAGNRYRVSFKKTDNPAEKIAETVVRSGCGLLQLRTEQRTIEDSFIEQTKSTNAHDSGTSS